jgi:hypothetical protein
MKFTSTNCYPLIERKYLEKEIKKFFEKLKLQNELISKLLTKGS